MSGVRSNLIPGQSITKESPLTKTLDSRKVKGLFSTAWKLRKQNITPIFNKGKRKDPRKYRTTSLALILGEGDGAPKSGSHFQMHVGQEVDQEHSAWIYKGAVKEIMLNQPDRILQ